MLIIFKTAAQILGAAAHILGAAAQIFGDAAQIFGGAAQIFGGAAVLQLLWASRHCQINVIWDFQPSPQLSAKSEEIFNALMRK